MSTLYDPLYYPQTVSIEEYGRVCQLTQQWEREYKNLNQKLNRVQAENLQLKAAQWCDSCDKMQGSIRTLQTKVEKLRLELQRADETIADLRQHQQLPSPKAPHIGRGSSESLWIRKSTLTREEIFQRVEAEAATFAITDPETLSEIRDALDILPPFPFQELLGRAGPAKGSIRVRPGKWSLEGLGVTA